MAYDKKKSRFKKRVCRFCGNKEINIDYKNVDLLRNYVSETGKIEPRRATVTCAKHQRLVSNEIKKARQMALIAYVVE
ncbi:MAG TPA: 30S ribosomal protein S18 [Candidatus Cloacimonadota bacterium]|nr:30S ribosomal protein S18 [Candidatus Cloacimonadota bacterium]